MAPSGNNAQLGISFTLGAAVSMGQAAWSPTSFNRTKLPHRFLCWRKARFYRPALMKISSPAGVCAFALDCSFRLTCLWRGRHWLRVAQKRTRPPPRLLHRGRGHVRPIDDKAQLPEPLQQREVASHVKAHSEVISEGRFQHRRLKGAAPLLLWLPSHLLYSTKEMS